MGRPSKQVKEETLNEIEDVGGFVEETNTVKEKVVEVSLKDSDEIEVISMSPNVSYFDKNTGNRYEWENICDSEHVAFSVLKNMWIGHKGYFTEMILKPNDDRVIKHFGIGHLYQKYDILMNPENYVKKNIDMIIDLITNAPYGIQFSVFNNIKSYVANGQISDVYVLKALGKPYGIDLTDFV